MGDNLLGRLPERLGDLRQLTGLYIHSMGLVDLPASFTALAALRTLDLGHNALPSLPEDIGRLSGLTHFLYLSHNRLTELPASLGDLTRLRYLNVSHNALEALPESTGRHGGFDGAAPV